MCPNERGPVLTRRHPFTFLAALLTLVAPVHLLAGEVKVGMGLLVLACGATALGSRRTPRGMELGMGSSQGERILRCSLGWRALI
jgi:hypothetical protein